MSGCEPETANPESVHLLARRILLGSGILGLILLAILVLQLRGIARNYPYYIVTGAESHCVYGVWKAQEGHPLYAWPQKDFLQLTLYNFGFYHLYAGFLDLLDAHGPKIMLYGRFLTALLAACGALFQALLIRRLTAPFRGSALIAAIYVLCFCTWFNSYFPGFYAVSVRPDIAAVAVSTLALYCFLRHVTGDGLKWLCLSTAMWIVAWCIKQADVAFIFGAGLYLLASRKFLPLAILSVLFLAPVCLILALGTPEYRWNLLVAPSVNSLHFAKAIQQFGMGALLSLFVWLPLFTLPLYFEFVFRKPGDAKSVSLLQRIRPGNDLAPLAALVFIVAGGGAFSFVALAKTGSSLNQMFEVFVAASTLSLVLLLRLAAVLPLARARLLGLIACACLLSMCLYPAAQLALHRIGPVSRGTPEQLSRKEDFAKFMGTLKKPVYIADEIYSLPWYSTDNNYPAIKLDAVFYDDAVAKGVVSGALEKLVSDHWFASLYLPPDSALAKVALAAGYQNSPLPPANERYLDSLGHESAICQLLVRP